MGFDSDGFQNHQAHAGMPRSRVNLAVQGLAAVLMFGLLVMPAWAVEATLQDWVGYWQQGDKLIVVSAPQDGAADVINIKVYPDGVNRPGGARLRSVAMRAYDTDLEHPRRIDGDGTGELKLVMRLSGQELRVEHQRAASSDIGDLSGPYRRNTSPLAMLWAERPAWLRFHCDCDVEAIEQSVLPQLASGYAVGKDRVVEDAPRLVMVTLAAGPPTVMVLTHSSDSECSQDGFRIVSRGDDGRWRGDVARWLGWARKPGGIQDKDLWQLSSSQSRSLLQMQDGNLLAVPRFWWQHQTKTLKVGMEACTVLPEGATQQTIDNARKLGDFAAAFAPRLYPLRSAVTGSPR